MNELEKKIAIVQRVIALGDDFVLHFDYRDSKGVETRRVASPIRVFNSSHLSAECWLRSEVRQFDLDRVFNLQVGAAFDVLAPIEFSAVNA